MIYQSKRPQVTSEDLAKYKSPHATVFYALGGDSSSIAKKYVSELQQVWDSDDYEWTDLAKKYVDLVP